MAPNTTTKPATTSREEDFLKDWDEIFAPSPEPAKKDKTTGKEDGSKKRKKDDVLGLEKEVDKKKQRVPRVKLDDARLLSDKGIPKMRKMAQTKLKFKGKGHEFSDAARLLSFYQEWLDDLFPKAAFLDALAMVEKAGHKTAMRNARLKWIDEDKPRSAEDEEEQDEYPIHTSTGPKKPTTIAPVFEKAAQSKAKTPENDDLFGDDDIYNATPRANKSTPAIQDIPDEDDLDALMAEAEMESAPPKKAAAPVTSIFGDESNDIPDDDDLDALMAEAEAQQAAPSKPPPKKTTPAATRGEFDDDDDLDALMAEVESTAITKPPAKAAAPGGVEEDDLDALMAEAEAQATSSKKDAGKSVATFDGDEEAMAEMDGLW
ncbi:replication fork protection component Swi3-domain-containing protein [Podospora fimiseda]|uniref:Chromosome segregation in meiosis protein n=1 Tax=Podospora fimiseda TaxID=252190 RepID=A0AAN7BKG7_9PEZI|nr:replication fork protection component Swi3-domain-containing protein [Podospora fimiseda]